jgi:hypothetical protein
MVRSILDHFRGDVDCSAEIAPYFHRRDLSYECMGESNMCETWRTFLQYHSMWKMGPRGVYLSETLEERCTGCQAENCVFYTEEDCRSIGKWIYNAKINGITIPVPIDPVSHHPKEVFFHLHPFSLPFEVSRTKY